MRLGNVGAGLAVHAATGIGRYLLDFDHRLGEQRSAAGCTKSVIQRSSADTIGQATE